MMKRKIVIASTLKPVYDVRSFLKIARSISKLDHIDILLMGDCNSNEATGIQNIRVYRVKQGSRLSLRRLINPIVNFIHFIILKPDVLIITTHELLFPAMVLSLLSRTKIIYDVQENYYLNLRCQKEYHPITGFILAKYVRLKEYMTSPFIEHYFLAEKCYSRELKFTGDRYTILENKALQEEPISIKTQSDTLQFLFSGTLSISSGLELVLSFVKKMKANNEAFKLKVIGQYFKYDAKQILDELDEFPVIELKISNQPIAYPIIAQAIQNADFGLVCYQVNNSNRNRIPTKVYEYLAANVKILCHLDGPWIETIRNYNGGMQMDFLNFDPGSIRKHLDQFTSSTLQNDKTDLLWTTEEFKLHNALNEILNN